MGEEAPRSMIFNYVSQVSSNVRAHIIEDVLKQVANDAIAMPDRVPRVLMANWEEYWSTEELNNDSGMSPTYRMVISWET